MELYKVFKLYMKVRHYENFHKNGMEFWLSWKQCKNIKKTGNFLNEKVDDVQIKYIVKVPAKVPEIQVATVTVRKNPKN